MNDHPDPRHCEIVIGTTTDGKLVTAQLAPPILTDHDPAGSALSWVVPSRRGGEEKTTVERPLPAAVFDEAAALLAAPTSLGDEARDLIGQIMRDGRKVTTPDDWEERFGLGRRRGLSRRYATIEKLNATAARAEFDLGGQAPQVR